MKKKENKKVPESKKTDVPINKNINIEAQAMMHTCKAMKCIIFFVNPNDHTDYVLQEIAYDNDYFVTRISEKLTSFFETYVAKTVFKNAITVKR